VGASKTDSGLPTIAGGRFFCCKPGHHREVSENGIEMCKECPKGSVAANHNADLSCQPCGRNYFSAAAGLSGCANCDSNMFSSIGKSQCTLCPAGQFMVHSALNTTCQVCIAGQFQEDSGKGNNF
jgi:ribosomal protein S27AE